MEPLLYLWPGVHCFVAADRKLTQMFNCFCSLSGRLIRQVTAGLRIGDCTLNYHDQGSGEPILLIHGSGPGVTAWANWRGVMPVLSRHARVIAQDMLRVQPVPHYIDARSRCLARPVDRIA